MKHSLSTEIGSPSKRPRVFDTGELLFDDAKQERAAIDIYRNGNDDTGYLSGTIFMIWPVMGNKLKIIFEARPQGEGGRHKFDIEFTGTCANHFQELCLKTQDEVQLALKGATLELSGSQISTLKMKLLYTEGALVKLVKRRGDLHPINKIINTWIREKHPSPSNSLDIPGSEDWFSTPHHQASLEQNSKLIPETTETTALPVVNHPVTPPLSAASTDTKQQQQQFPNVSANINDTTSTYQTKSPRSYPPHSAKTRPDLQTNLPVQTLTKKQLRRAKKRNHGKSKLHTPLDLSTDRAVMDKNSESSFTPEQPRKDSTSSGSALSSTEFKFPTSKIATPSTMSNVGELTSAKPERPEIFALKAGLTTSRGDLYSAIDTLKVTKMVHLFGVVVSVTIPKMTIKGHFSCSLRIVDPSQIIIESFSTNEGFKINFFTEKYPQWLPCPALNDIVILRNIKIGEWNGLNGVGYADRFQWAVYSSKNGGVTHGDLQNVPRFRGLAGGYSGQLYSPFFEPAEEEIRYCLRLTDWWQAVERHRQGLCSDIHQVQVPSRARALREHRLISEVDPSIPPQGYFNCTVEVWYVHMNDNGVCSLYVTDYTANSSTIPCSQQWCPPRLSDFILKVEVWDSAVETARTMAKGEFYCIKNLRAVISTGGYLEGKLVENKIERLEETAVGQNGPLGALIERKKAWEEANPPVTNTFEFSLIENAPVNRHFTCAIEVVHVVPKTGYIYVTDYTSRAELLSPFSNEPWTVGLRGMVVKILLQEGQVEVSNIVVKGEYYLINNLRLKPSTVASQFLGYLGGNDDLVQKINVKKDNNKFDALLTRKASWRKAQICNQSNGYTTNSGPPTPTALTQSARKSGYTTISEVIADKRSTNKFRVEARIVDFYPPDPYDWVITHCTRCEKDLPKNLISCTICNDSEYEFRRYFYQIFLLLEDEHGHQLRVSINDNCSIFKGLKRADIRTNQQCYEALYTRIEPVFGSLIKALREKTNNMPVLSATPVISLIINSWDIEGEQKRAYCVASVEGEEDT
ncbi:hypothetical protein BDZ94DRAFT_1244088 [Collybia nuda]|uniref:Protection of telomeres protein 1 n=1 Tax=Collybia nuda TaxID=64659 RepID=A0A9P5YG05_9AGAR|nr:hypothetical protein BDZ94DRAFT_1244088 [Collybia nuda]